MTQRAFILTRQTSWFEGRRVSHLCDARVRTLLPHKCRVPPVPFPPLRGARIEVCSLDILVACWRTCTGFRGHYFRDASMRALLVGTLITCLKKFNVSGAMRILKMRLSIQNVHREWLLQSEPLCGHRKTGPGIEISSENENLKTRMNISSGNGAFVRGGMFFFFF